MLLTDHCYLPLKLVIVPFRPYYARRLVRRVAHSMLDPLAHGLRAGANHPDVFPSEALADEKLSLAPPRSVRVTICVKPILLGHQRKVYFAYPGEVIIECLWFLRGMAVGEYKLIPLRHYALRSSGEIIISSWSSGFPVTRPFLYA